MRSAFRHYLTKKRIRNVLQLSYLTKTLQRIGNSWHVTWRRVFNASGRSCKLLEEDVPTYQEHLASYLKKMLRRIRNILQVTWRRCYNVAGTSCMLLEEDMTTYQERPGSYERLASDLTKMLEHIRSILQVTWRRCYAVSGTSCKLLQEDVTTYQERLASHLTKMLRRSRNVLPVCAQEHERYYPTPPPWGNWSWKSSAVPVSAGQQERWWGCCAWPNVPAPCPQVLP